LALYDEIGGFDVILSVTARWHELCLADPMAAHPFEQAMHPQHNERLAAYLAEAFGGPKLYSAGYGDESHVQRVHAGNGVHVELDEACLRCFDQALSDLGIVGAVAERVSAYFRRATEEQRAYSSRDSVVPAGLPLNMA
jgi:hemoglobin